MTQYQVDLYDFFSDEVTRALKRFCHRVNHSDADVFIIMAHKAVLLFYLLLAQGHINKQAAEKVIISNLALSFNCRCLEGKKIAILDDIVISGTTIASAVSKLMSVGVRQDDIDVIAVAIDQDYFNMSFENTKGNSVLHCDYTPKDAPCIELSAVISKVFSYYGIPYDVDFPIYEQIPISETALSALHSNLFWDIADVSNWNQKNGNVNVYTLSPAQPVLERLWSTIGADLGHCADIKLRLYIKRYPDGTQECCIVPMCLFKEVSQDELSALYDLLKPSARPLAISKEKPWKAQMRYLEFYIAHQLFTIFSALTSLGHGVMFHEDIAKRLFGPIDGETVYRHLSASQPQSGSAPLMLHQAQVDHSETIENYKQSNTYKNLRRESVNWRYGSDYQKGCWINQFIFSFFLWWYDTKEILIRNQLKKQRLHYVKNYQTIQSYLYRLENGLPMSVLRQMLQFQVPDISDQEAECAISAFVDRAIDEGIIVPTIHYSEDGKYLCRAYRHGEDLPFGAADQYRLVYFLQSIGMHIQKAENCTIPAVAEISLEKMIVLFYQMGLRWGNVFNRFLGFDETEIIHSFLSLHGRVQGYSRPEVTPHIYSERDSDGTRYITWLTVWLYEKGLIGKRPAPSDSTESNQAIPIKLNKIKQYLENNQRSIASDMVLSSIDSIAELITIWYNGMAKEHRKTEFRDNITALTSCANRFVYISAIATEIHYFSNYWKHQAQYALRETCDSESLVERLRDNTDNNRYTANIIQGLHSGREKVQWRYTNKAQEVINTVAKDFLGSTSTSVWNQLWSCVDKEPEDNASQLRCYTNMAEAFLYFFSACFECLNSTDFWDSGTLPSNFDDYKGNYLERVRQTSKLDGSLFDSLEEVARLDAANLEEKSAKLNKLAREALFSSERCVSEIETLVQDRDPTYTISYKSALILDIAALDSSQIEPALLRFWEQIPEDSTKTELNLIRFPRNKEGTSPFFKYGIFLGKVGPQHLDTYHNIGEPESLRYGKELHTAFQRVCSLLNGRLCQIRGILLPHVVPGSTFNHNLQRNINKNADDFYQAIVKPLEVCYEDRWNMQLVLGLDRYVDEKFTERFQGWQQHPLGAPIDGAEWVTNCVVCGKEHIEIAPSSNLMERGAYSQLKVSCGGKRGLGLLMRLSDRVVCVSCNHIFTDYSQENEPYAVSAYDPAVRFPLRPLTPIQCYPSPSYILSAKNEVIFLEPCWDGTIPYDVRMLISLEDWGEPEADAKCKCYVCNDEDEMKWVDFMHVAGANAKGYYQIDADIDTTLTEIQEGVSGGTYVRVGSPAESKIIGIHEGRFDEVKKVRMIPRTPVQAAIQALSERSRTDGKEET